MGSSTSGASTRALRTIGVLVIVAGAVFAVAGVVTWFVMRDQLADENITVSDDADRFAGEPVDGPLTAYSQANTTASFLRAFLFTSVVAFGVAAFAVGVGAVLIVIGIALLRIHRRLEGPALA